MLELLLCKVGKALFGLFATQERIMSKLHIAIIGIISCTINVIYQRRFLPQRIHRLLHLVQMSAYHSVLSHQICLYLMILSHLFFHLFHQLYHLFHQILLYPLILSHQLYRPFQILLCPLILSYQLLHLFHQIYCID